MNKSDKITYEQAEAQFDKAEKKLLLLDPTGEDISATNVYEILEWFRGIIAEHCLTTQSSINEDKAEIERLNEELKRVRNLFPLAFDISERNTFARMGYAPIGDTVPEIQEIDDLKTENNL